MEEGILVDYESGMNGTVGQSSACIFYPTWGILCTGFGSEESEVSVKAQPTEISLELERRNGTRRRSRGKVCKKWKDRKELGPDCGCPSKCFEKVGEETIRKVFHDFWALADYNSQNAYLFGLISLLGVKRRYTKKEISRRNFTVNYCVKKKGQNVAVCKKAFLNIHGLQRNRGRVNNLTNKMKKGESVPPPDRRGRHANRPNAYSPEAIEHVRRHLLLWNGGERKKRSKKQAGTSTKTCYELYVKEYCKENGLIPVSLDKFRRVVSTEGYKNRSRGGPGGSQSV